MRLRVRRRRRSAADIDAGMVLGLNYPRGPLAWADAIGLDHVLAVLEGLWRSTARSATAPPRSCSAWCAPAGWDARAARASSSYERLERTSRFRARRRSISEQQVSATATSPRRSKERAASSRRERRTTAISALSRHPPRGGVALPGLLRRASRRRGLLSGDLHRGTARLSAPAGRLEPARVGADDRPSQGARCPTAGALPVARSPLSLTEAPGRNGCVRGVQQPGAEPSARRGVVGGSPRAARAPALSDSAALRRATFPTAISPAAIGCSEEAARRSLHEGLSKLRKVVA